MPSHSCTRLEEAGSWYRCGVIRRGASATQRARIGRGGSGPSAGDSPLLPDSSFGSLAGEVGGSRGHNSRHSPFLLPPRAVRSVGRVPATAVDAAGYGTAASTLLVRAAAPDAPGWPVAGCRHVTKTATLLALEWARSGPPYRKAHMVNMHVLRGHRSVEEDPDSPSLSDSCHHRNV